MVSALFQRNTELGEDLITSMEILKEIYSSHKRESFCNVQIIEKNMQYPLIHLTDKKSGHTSQKRCFSWQIFWKTWIILLQGVLQVSWEEGSVFRQSHARNCIKELFRLLLKAKERIFPGESCYLNLLRAALKPSGRKKASHLIIFCYLLSSCREEQKILRIRDIQC